MDDELAKAYAAVEKLHVWTRGGERAPHKPLLILFALSRLQDKGSARLMAFPDIEQPLRQLIKDYGPRRGSYHPEYPFWRLQADRIWEVPDAQSIPLRNGQTDPLVSALRERPVRGGFVAPLYDHLVGHPKDVRELADYTAGEYLADMRLAVLQELHLQ